MTTTIQAPAPHRLSLTAAEFAVLTEAAGVALPPWFGADPAAERRPDPFGGLGGGFTTGTGPAAATGGERTSSPGEEAAAREEEVRRQAVADLLRRDVLTADPDNPMSAVPVASVGANLAILAAPQVSIQTEVSLGDRGLRAFYAIRGQLGASLFTLAEGGVELSVFPALSLGWELVRSVPGEQELAAAESPVASALRGLESAAPPLSGRLPLAALAEYGPASRLAGRGGGDRVAEKLGLTSEQQALVGRVNRETVGMLRCLVAGTVDDGTAFAQVIWLATGAGWVAVRPDPTPGESRPVLLEPVRRVEIGTTLAPYLAQLLEGPAR